MLEDLIWELSEEFENIDPEEDKIKYERLRKKGRYYTDRFVSLFERTDDDDLRGALVTVLGELGDKTAVEPLLKVLNNSLEDDLLRFNSAIALGRLGETRSVESIIEYFRFTEVTEDLWEIGAWSLMGAIADIGGDRAKSFLVEMLKHNSDQIREAASKYLRDFQDDKVVLSLIKALDDSYDLCDGVLLGRWDT